MSSKNRLLLSLALLLAANAIFFASKASANFDQCSGIGVSRPDHEMVLRSLSNRRDIFLNNGSFVDMFPALYYSTTKRMLEFTKTFRPEDAALINEQIILFYEAYETNRAAFESKGVSGVESHWKGHYRDASRLDRKNDVSAFEVLWLILSGVDAHINDLPRSIRFQLTASPDSKERLKVIYFELNKFYAEVIRDFENDLNAALGKRGKPAPAISNLNAGANYVIHARLRAWESAVGNIKLKASKPQPRLCIGKGR